MFYKDNLPQECLCAGAIFYNGDSESFRWLKNQDIINYFHVCFDYFDIKDIIDNIHLF